MNNITDWINPSLPKKLNSFKQEFSKGKPFPHILLPNFLKESKANLLLASLKRENFIEKESDLFNFKQTHDLYFSKNKILKQFNSDLLSWDFFKIIEKITNSQFRGILDMSGSLYESTSFLLPHGDELEGRKIAYVLYLSKNFKSSDGGAFLLYNTKNNTPTTLAKKYPPAFNSLLLFEVSKISFHEVEENLSKKSRYAIGGWLH